MNRDMQQRVYAGVLGKIIGVYMGRPVEGWSYDAIRERFGYVDYYVAQETGAPLIVPDDDISGTFVFYRALEDCLYNPNLSAEDIGEAWLNYIIEDKTILWWGGLARSTEHSAYLRLKQGYKPPLSGSGTFNGMAIAEQIGAQIFIDTWAMVNPGNPKLAAEMARKASVVSHDGIAVECAVYLAALEAMAFVEKDVPTLLSSCRQYIGKNPYGELLHSLLDDLFEQCSRAASWREVHDWIEKHHNYEKYKGNCPMVTNHLAVLMSLIMAGDDFRKSIAIASSSGWDTDCNAGNVGCLNAIRLGLDAINADADLRKPIADRMYVVSSDGGSVISDAVLETRNLVKAAALLNHGSVTIPEQRFAFEYPGSMQGFTIHPIGVSAYNPIKQLEHTVLDELLSGLRIQYEGLSGSVTGCIAVQTYVDPTPKAAPDTSYFEVYASPTLYSGQTVTAELLCEGTENPDVRFFIDYYNGKDEISSMYAEKCWSLKQGKTSLDWVIPDTGGRSVYKVGLQLLSDTRKDGSIILLSMDWKGAPTHFHMGLANELTPGISPFVTRTKWMMAFMNSMKHSGPDFKATLAMSHPEDNGVMTLGTLDWTNYTVASSIQFMHAAHAGLVARSKGHRRYYAALFRDGKYQLVKRKRDKLIVLSEAKASYEEGNWYDVAFSVHNDTLTMSINGTQVLQCQDNEFSSGGTGYVVSEGSIVARMFDVYGAKEP